MGMDNFGCLNSLFLFCNESAKKNYAVHTAAAESPPSTTRFGTPLARPPLPSPNPPTYIIDDPFCER